MGNKSMLWLVHHALCGCILKKAFLVYVSKLYKCPCTVKNVDCSILSTIQHQMQATCSLNCHKLGKNNHESVK